MESLGTRAYANFFSNFRDRFVPDDGHETVWAGVEVHVRGAPKSLHEHHAAR